jgi:uncharacterized Zn-binding protein involved in type VI secretion
MSKKLIARKGDTTTGYCSIHDETYSGTITGSAANSKCEGKLIARIGDEVTASCGDKGTINQGSSDIGCEGQGVAHLGDSFSGTYSGTITGSAVKSKAS